MIELALDAMGGDYAPGEIIQGALQALKAYPVRLSLLGPQKVIEKQLQSAGQYDKSRVTIIHAPDIVDMADSPTLSFRRKKNSSIRLGLQLVKDKKVDGFVSAGNTGAVMTASVLILGKTPNIERPAIASILPSRDGQFVMLDMGSSVDCKAEHLAQFAVMGSYFSELLLGVANPRVGLLNIGEEKTKGNTVSQAAFSQMKELPINFVGNVEGKDILFSVADVVVCDGFVGNTLLKFGEGVADLFFNFFKKEAKSSLLSLVGLLLLKPALKRFKKEYDYAEYGGAPLLGVEGVSVVAHGKSDAFAIKNAIHTAMKACNSNIVEKISKAVGQ
ncbi:phosphate acyltransferase PlsX [Thermoproteota archaeon]